MTDSRTSSKYIKALEEVRKLDKEPVGFSDITTSVQSNNIPIRQNNIIIQLIINLAEKLDQIEEQVAEINQFVHNSSANLPPALVKKLDNLTLENNNKAKNHFWSLNFEGLDTLVTHVSKMTLWSLKFDIVCHFGHCR